MRFAFLCVLALGCSSSESGQVVDAGRMDSAADTAKSAEELCDTFCGNLGTVCPEFVKEIGTGEQCKTGCLNPESPPGYRECNAAAKTCDELADCKMRF